MTYTSESGSLPSFASEPSALHSSISFFFHCSYLTSMAFDVSSSTSISFSDTGTTSGSVLPVSSLYASWTFDTSIASAPLSLASLTRSTISPVASDFANCIPIGKPSRFLPLAIAPANFSGMPPTGPIVPSGLIVPVIETVGSIAAPVIVARKPPAISPDALGPSM